MTQISSKIIEPFGYTGIPTLLLLNELLRLNPMEIAGEVIEKIEEIIRRLAKHEFINELDDEKRTLISHLFMNAALQGGAGTSRCDIHITLPKDIGSAVGIESTRFVVTWKVLGSPTEYEQVVIM